MPAQSVLPYLFIVGAEVAFWLVLLLGLAVRYLLRREAASRWLLLSLPLIDLALLTATAWHLRAGATATLAHGLAAVYVGFTVVFGAFVVRWADARFAHRFAGGPRPQTAPRTGWRDVRFELALWARCIAAWIIALALIEALTAYVGNAATTQPLRAWYRYALASIFFWLIFGPGWSLVFLRREAQ